MAAEGGIPVALVGATGLTGSAILARLQLTPAVQPVHAITRRALSATTLSAKVQSHVEGESGAWAGVLAALQPAPAAFVSALGTTRGAAGGVANQRKIDYDLNLELATAARERGVGTYVLVSSAGSRGAMASYSAYMRMKLELEEAVAKLGFDHTVIIRPGLLVGERADSRPAEGLLRGIAKGLGSISKGLTDFWAQDVDTIARAAVCAMQDCVDGKREKGVWVLEQADIVRLGANK